MVLMKIRALRIINVLLFILLTGIDIVLMVQFGVPNNDGWFLIALAAFCFVIYLSGRLFPHHTISLLYKIWIKAYRISNIESFPVFDEAKKLFINRLPYLLMITNILMLLLMLVIIFN